MRTTFVAAGLVCLAVIPVVAAPPAKSPHPPHAAKTYAALVDAVKAGDLTAVRQKIKQGADVNETDDIGLAPLDFATSPAMIRLLRAHGAGYGIASNHLSATAEQKLPASDPLPLGLRTENIIKFFQDFITDHPIPQRSQFETEAEYQARLGPAFDQSRVYYFPVDAAVEDGPKFKYDIDSKMMTVMGGSEELVSGRTESDAEPEDVTAIVLHIKDDDQGEYDAQTAGGAQIKVSKSATTDYDLDFVNASDWPVTAYYSAGDDKDKHHFLVSFAMGPKAAEELSHHMKMVLGVNLEGYQNAGSRFSDYHKPTFDEPNEFTMSVDWIEAKLVSVSVWDTEAKKIVSQVLVPLPVVPSTKPLPPGFTLPSDALNPKDSQ